MTNVDIITLAFTATIAVTGVIGAVIFNDQLTAMRGQLKEMKRAVDVADDTSKRQLRAYVGVERFDVELPNLTAPKYQPLPAAPGIVFSDFMRAEIKNYGQTPATDVSVHMNFQPVPDFGADLPADFGYPDYEAFQGTSVEVFASRQIVEPGKSIETRTVLRDISALRAAHAGKARVFFYGHIDYTDIYNRRWRKDYCYSYEWWRPEGDRFVPYKAHNEEHQLE
ncbi:MAG: hypothetical protein WAU56_07380 [Steroidobacteraceae bacterium]